MRLGLLALAVLAIPVATPAQQEADRAADIMRKAASTYHALSSFQADFRQKIDDPRIEQPETRGVLYQSGDRFAMRFSDPKGGAFVLDGRHAWFYDPDGMPGQVMKMPMPSGPAYDSNLLGWFLDRPLEKYHATFVREDKLDGHPVDVLTLEPLSANMRFRRATIWINRDNSLPLRFDINEKLFVRHLTLSHIRTNGSIPPAVFEFKTPPGVRVVEQ